MRTRIRKWGNSLGVRIPRALAEAARVAEGATVDLAVRGGRLVVRRVAPKAEAPLDLQSLVRRITPRNRHREVDFGGPVGAEAW